MKDGDVKKKKLSAHVSDMLTAHLREREAKPDEPLLVNRNGTRWSRQAFSNMIVRWVRRDRGARAAHLIRHTVASIAALDGATVCEIAGRLTIATCRRRRAIFMA